MNVEALLTELIQNKVKISVQDNKLLCQFPEGGIDSNLMERLKEHKEALKQVLTDAKYPALKRPPIVKLNDTSRRKLSFAQQRLWVLDQIEGSAHYNISSALLLEGKLDLNVFQRTFDTILERHEILRTTYELSEDGNAYQIIHHAGPLHIYHEDLSELSEDGQKERIRQLQRQEARQPFDLKKDTLLRVSLIRIKQDAFVVLVTVHHIATDGWSMGILIKEFSALYTAFYNGQDNPLPALTIQYADYAGWQQQWLQGETLETLKRYWAEQLQDLPSLHSLPADHSRPRIQTFKGHTVQSKIDLESLNALKRICEREGATLFTGLYTVFTVLLARYSNENDIVLGTPIANREQSEVSGLIGFFVNMLVLRSKLPADAGFIHLLRQHKQMLLDAYAHQQMPFDMLVSALQQERNPGYSSLFQIMFVLQNNEKAGVKLPELSLKPIEQPKPFSMYDLSLLADENSTGLLLNWEYNTDIFDTTTIQRMAGHFDLLLHSLVQSPDNDVRKVKMMSEEDVKQVLVTFNQTEQIRPVYKTVIDLFEEQAVKAPDATALFFDGRSMTYGQLNEQTNRIARYLLERSNGRPDKIGVVLNRSIESVIAMVAVMKTGACYVPIDYKLPLSTIDHILQDTGIQLVLTKRNIGDVKKEGLELVLIDELDFSAYDATDLHVPVQPDAASYVIYTSGSTGKPKGVIQTHLMLSNLIRWNALRSGVEPGKRLLQYASFYFDVSLQDCWFTLCHGGKLYITNDDIRTDFRSLLQYIINNRLEVLVFPFSAMNAFFMSNELSDFEGHSIRHIVASGEQLVVNASLHAFMAHNRDVKLHNHYGPSETHVVTSFTTSYAEELALKALSIGKPVDNTRIYILDAYLQPVPVGVKGEIYIEGDNLALGYLNLPQLTAERFIASPFKAGKKLYKTGDIAYWLPDGNIIYSNRNDHQVKVRGYRIELREIERVLEELTYIRSATVTVFEDGGQKSLCAYLVTDQELDILKLRTYLHSRIADYMLPAYFVRIESIPITSNGKLDKRALPNPLSHGLRVLNEYTPPETDIEQALVAIWEQVLNRKHISVTENFFELGGDSIKVIGLLQRVHKQYNLQIKIIDFFTKPTVRLLAEEISIALLLRKQQTRKETKALKI